MNGIEFECCNGTCNQGRNCPMREQRPVAGTGLVIAVDGRRRGRRPRRDTASGQSERLERRPNRWDYRHRRQPAAAGNRRAVKATHLTHAAVSSRFASP